MDKFLEQLVHGVHLNRHRFCFPVRFKRYCAFLFIYSERAAEVKGIAVFIYKRIVHIKAHSADVKLAFSRVLLGIWESLRENLHCCTADFGTLVFAFSFQPCNLFF